MKFTSFSPLDLLGVKPASSSGMDLAKGVSGKVDSKSTALQVASKNSADDFSHILNEKSDSGLKPANASKEDSTKELPAHQVKKSVGKKIENLKAEQDQAPEAKPVAAKKVSEKISEEVSKPVSKEVSKESAKATSKEDLKAAILVQADLAPVADLPKVSVKTSLEDLIRSLEAPVAQKTVAEVAPMEVAAVETPVVDVKPPALPEEIQQLVNEMSEEEVSAEEISAEDLSVLTDVSAEDAALDSQSVIQSLDHASEQSLETQGRVLQAEIKTLLKSDKSIKNVRADSLTSIADEIRELNTDAIATDSALAFNTASQKDAKAEAPAMSLKNFTDSLWVQQQLDPKAQASAQTSIQTNALNPFQAVMAGEEAQPQAVRSQLVADMKPLIHRVLQTEQGGEMVLSLKPGNLGAVKVSIQMEQKAIRLVIEAAEQSSKEMLQSQSHELKAQLKQVGLKVDELQVTKMNVVADAKGVTQSQESSLNHEQANRDFSNSKNSHQQQQESMWKQAQQENAHRIRADKSRDFSQWFAQDEGRAA